MKANGFGRTSNGQWTKIISPRQHNRTFRQLIDNHNNTSSNPYQVLEEPTTQQLKKLELPHGEIIFTTFNSISELSAYLANLPIHITRNINLDKQHLCDKHNKLSNSYKNNDNLPNTYKILDKTDPRSSLTRPSQTHKHLTKIPKKQTLLIQYLTKPWHHE